MVACLLVATGTWSTLAVGYGARGPGWCRLAAAGLVGIVAAACVLGLPRRAAILGGLGLFGGVLGWWLSLTPSNGRSWEPEYATTATAARDGDQIRLGHVRNFAWRPDGSFVPTYYDTEVHLDQLDEVNMISSYWSGEAIAHVFLSFGFTDGQHVAVSVETRRERGEPYSAIAGFFRRYELIYVVADERDLIGVRTDIRRESVYLYRVRATPAEMRALFLSYVDRIAKLSGTPEFYNTLDNNCTTNVVQRANAAAGGIPLSWMILVSGYADRYAYELGRLDRHLPFPELKQRSLIRRAPGATIDAGFSAEIRTGLPS